MFRFTRKNGITGGVTKKEVDLAPAHGLRNFKNYRLRVRVLCC